MKKASIVVILIVFAFILCACGKSKQAQEADDLILAIGEVSLDSAAAIETAENAVSELSDRQRNQLENREILESARSTFSNLQYVQSHPFEYPLPLDFSWEMSLADAEKFGFDLSPIEPDRQGFTADGAALDFGKNEVTITCTYDFGKNNDSLNRVNLIIQLSEDYDGTTEDALWTIMNFYYKNIGTSPDVNAGTASCIWKTGQSTIELFCTFASSGLFFITYLPLA